MAATETTKDSVIVIPTAQESKVKVEETETGTKVTVDQPAKKVSYTVEDGGTVSSTGSGISKALFTFTGAGSVEITNNAVKDSKVLGSDSNDGVAIGVGVTQTAAKDVKINTGEGSDTVTVSTRVAKKIKINLGEDTDADNIRIDTDIDKIKDLVIMNFGKEDTFTFGNKTYTADQLKNQPFLPNIEFKFSN